MPVVYEIPPGVTYSCTMCGDCCRTYNILLTGEERDRLEGFDWSGRVERLAGIPKTRPSGEPATKGRPILARQGEDPACVFLGDRNQCLVHEHFGEEAKPLTCRLYPWSFYPLGSRVGVNVAFSCKSVSEGTGAPVDAGREPEWTRAFFHTHGGTDRGRHFLVKGRELPGDLAWEFERILMAYLIDRSMTFLDRVRCCLEFLRLGTTGDPASASAGAFREAIAAGVPRQLDRIHFEARMEPSQRGALFQWLFILLNPVPLDFFLQARSRQAEIQQEYLAAGEEFRDCRGRPWINGRALSVEFDEIARMDCGLLSEPDQTALEAFFQAKVIGQKFLMAGKDELPLAPAARRLLLYFPMAVWTAKAYAADRGATAVEDADLRRALRALDQTVGLHYFEALSARQSEALEFILSESGLAATAAADLIQA